MISNYGAGLITAPECIRQSSINNMRHHIMMHRVYAQRVVKLQQRVVILQDKLRDKEA